MLLEGLAILGIGNGGYSSAIYQLRQLKEQSQDNFNLGPSLLKF